MADGRLHLSGAFLIAPFLTAESSAQLISAAVGRSKRDIEEMLANRNPKPDAVPCVRRAPTRPAPTPVASPAPTAQPSAPPAPSQGTSAPRPTPLGDQRYKVQFTADRALMDKLEEAQALLSHRVRPGDLAAVFDKALDVLCEQLRRERFAELNRPGPSPPPAPPPGTEAPSRHIPRAIRRTVFERDGGRCTFVAPGGTRCAERRFIEFHHIEPWARRPEHTVEGITLRCRAHNQHQARLDFGSEAIDRHVAARRSCGPAP
jgi:hypothetical protein